MDDLTLRIALLRCVGFEQRAIARHVGVSQQTVSRKLKELRAAGVASGDPYGYAAKVVLAAVSPTWMRDDILKQEVPRAGRKSVSKVSRASRPGV